MSKPKALVLGRLPNDSGVRVAIVSSANEVTPFKDNLLATYAYVDITWDAWDEWMKQVREWRILGPYEEEMDT